MHGSIDEGVLTSLALQLVQNLRLSILLELPLKKIFKYGIIEDVLWKFMRKISKKKKTTCLKYS